MEERGQMTLVSPFPLETRGTPARSLRRSRRADRQTALKQRFIKLCIKPLINSAALNY